MMASSVSEVAGRFSSLPLKIFIIVAVLIYMGLTDRQLARELPANDWLDQLILYAAGVVPVIFAALTDIENIDLL